MCNRVMINIKFLPFMIRIVGINILGPLRGILTIEHLRMMHGIMTY